MNSILTGRVDDDVPPGVRVAADVYSRRASDNEPEVPRVPTWREIGAIVALVSIAYTVGYNWKEITTLRVDHDRFVLQNNDEHKTFKLKGESDVEYREIQRQLSEMNRLLEKADWRGR